MAGVRNGARFLACLIWATAGCGRAELTSTAACDELGAGDLVITEVLANPDGSDGDREYIELFNASGAPLYLDGLVLSSSRSDGGGGKYHRLAHTEIDEGDYFVFGNAPAGAMPAHLDYSYGSTLGALRNSDGLIAVRCGDRLIDQATYERTTDGVALELDGRLAPDEALNDDAANWCNTPEGVNEAFAGNFGTPGFKNSPCDPVPIESECIDGELARPIVPPRAEDVQIAEWMANPSGPDPELEWVEVWFRAEADLNDFQLGPDADSLKRVLDQEACFRVGAGARVIFGASPAAAPRVDAELRFALGNSGSRSIVAAVDGVVLDQVDYDRTVEGVAWQLDSDGNICAADPDDAYLDDNLGTPGEPNRVCPPVLGPGMCLDEGAPREIVSPRPGEARIVEWMADPTAVDNRNGEWLEVRFDAAADLNGLVLSDLNSSAIAVHGGACRRVAAGEHLVFARNGNPLGNGGLDEVDGELPLSLNNGDETISLSVDGRVLDSVSYERSTPGVATQVDELGERCDAVQRYGDGDWGTPGFANPRCS